MYQYILGMYWYEHFRRVSSRVSGFQMRRCVRPPSQAALTRTVTSPRVHFWKRSASDFTNLRILLEQNEADCGWDNNGTTAWIPACFSKWSCRRQPNSIIVQLYFFRFERAGSASAAHTASHRLVRRCCFRFKPDPLANHQHLALRTSPWQWP